MRTQTSPSGWEEYGIEAFWNGAPPVYVIETGADYTDPAFPQQFKDLIARREIQRAAQAAEAPLAAAFEVEQQQQAVAEFEEFKERDGLPAYPSVDFKKAADKLGALDEIEIGVDDLVALAGGDKEIRIWWDEHPTISAGDAEWQTIDAETKWPAGVTADDVFTLAATFA